MDDLIRRVSRIGNHLEDLLNFMERLSQKMAATDSRRFLEENHPPAPQQDPRMSVVFDALEEIRETLLFMVQKPDKQDCQSATKVDVQECILAATTPLEDLARRTLHEVEELSEQSSVTLSQMRHSRG